MDIESNFRNFNTKKSFSEIVDENFSRNSGIYTYLSITKYKIKLNNSTLIIPDKIILCDGHQKFDRKIETKNTITYKTDTIAITEKTSIIPFRDYQRKFKFSGKLSEILNDLNVFSDNSQFFLSNDLLENRKSHLYGIDSQLKYPAYLIAIKTKNKNSEEHNRSVFSKYDDQTIEFVRDALSPLFINYNVSKLDGITSFILFPLPYTEILENRLNTENIRESIYLTIRKNNNFDTIFQKNSFKVRSIVSELNSEKVDSRILDIPFSKREIQTIEIIPENVEKIGKTIVELLINDIVVNKFSGSYLRGIKFKLNLKSHE